MKVEGVASAIVGRSMKIAEYSRSVAVVNSPY